MHEAEIHVSNANTEELTHRSRLSNLNGSILSASARPRQRTRHTNQSTGMSQSPATARYAGCLGALTAVAGSVSSKWSLAAAPPLPWSPLMSIPTVTVASQAPTIEFLTSAAAGAAALRGSLVILRWRCDCEHINSKSCLYVGKEGPYRLDAQGI